MNEWIKNMMINYGYFAVVFLILIENVFPPIPSELILLMGGFMTVYAGLNVILMIIVSTIGSLLGAYVLYYLGYKLGNLGINKLLDGKVGRAIHLTSDDFLRSRKWFEEKGDRAVFLCRFVPLLRSIISIPAGVAKMELKKFTLLTTIGSVIWNTILIIVGRFAGQNWEKYSDVLSSYFDKIGIAAVLLVVLYIVYKTVKSHKDKQKA